MAAARTKVRKIKINRVTKPSICFLSTTGFITRIYHLDKGQYLRHPYSPTPTNLLRGPGVVYYTTPDRNTERTPPDKVHRCVPHLDLQSFDRTMIWRAITSDLRNKAKDIVEVFGVGVWETVPPQATLPAKYHINFSVEKTEFHLLACALSFYYGYSTTDSLDLLGHYIRDEEAANAYINKGFTVADLAGRIVFNEYQGEEETRLRA